MRRRELIGCAATALVAASVALAQPHRKTPRLAIVSPFEPVGPMSADSSNRYYRALFAELQRLGHVEGRTLTIERYGQEQNTDGIAALIAEVISHQPDLVYFVGSGAAFFKKATIPVVALTGDPLGQGIAQSLAHPGANITGVSVDAGPSLYAKRIELLRELAPALSKLGVVVLRAQWEAGASRIIGAAGEENRLPYVPVLIDQPTSDAAYVQAISAAKDSGADAVMIFDNPDPVRHQTAVIQAAAAAQLPAIYFLREFVDAGGLAAYTFDLVSLNEQAARDIDAILHGAKPGDIPFYQNTKFNLYINMTTAKALGLTVPPAILARADEVIE